MEYSVTVFEAVAATAKARAAELGIMPAEPPGRVAPAAVPNSECGGGGP